jgi:hypothetical protein
VRPILSMTAASNCSAAMSMSIWHSPVSLRT